MVDDLDFAFIDDRFDCSIIERFEGVCWFSVLLFRFVRYILSTPSPLRGTPACLRGRVLDIQL